MAHFFASCWFLLRRIDVVVCFYRFDCSLGVFWGGSIYQVLDASCD